MNTPRLEDLTQEKRGFFELLCQPRGIAESGETLRLFRELTADANETEISACAKKVYAQTKEIFHAGEPESPELDALMRIVAQIVAQEYVKGLRDARAEQAPRGS